MVGRMRLRISSIAWLMIGAAAVTAAGCQKAQAKTPGPAPVVLTVPEPPDRLHIPVNPDPPPPVASAEKPPPPPNPAKPRPTPTPTPTPPAGSTTPPPPPPDPATTPVVQAGSQEADEARAKLLLSDAERNLSKLNPKALGRDARQQYDSAQNFVKLGRTALNQRRFRYAAYCADKAATLAALLIKSED